MKDNPKFDEEKKAKKLGIKLYADKNDPELKADYKRKMRRVFGSPFRLF